MSREIPGVREWTLDVRALAPGVYVLVIRFRDGHTGRRLIIKR
jgi:hypothetical protein